MYSEAALAHDDGATAPVADAEAPVTNVANPASASGDARKRRGPAFFAPLRGASFRRLLLGQTVSRFGDQFYFVAIPWLVLRAGGGPAALSAVVGAAAVTLGIFTLAGGVLADRYGPRALMLGADLARLVIMGGLAALAILSTPPLWALIAISAALGVGGGLFYPASGAMIPYLVPEEDRQAANSFDQITMQTGNFVGPSVAGVLLTVTQLAFGFVLDAVSFLISVVTLFAIRMPARQAAASQPARTSREDATQAKGKGGLASLFEAVRYLRATPFLFTLLGLSLLGNFSANGLFEVGMPLLLKDMVGLAEGPRAMGFVIGGFGLGSIIGAVAAGVASRIPHKPLVAIIVLVPVAALMGFAPFAGAVLPLAGVFAVMGVLLALSNVLFITVIQSLIPMEMMGRMMSLTMLGSFAGTPLSIFVYGAAATIVPSVAWLFLAGGSLFGFACLLALTRKVIWQTA